MSETTPEPLPENMPSPQPGKPLSLRNGPADPSLPPGQPKPLEPRIPGLIRHGQCGRSWTGATRGHCSGCHETFSSGAFDMHQRISGGVVTCSTDGLTAKEKPWGTLWLAPNDGEYSWGQVPAEEDAA